MLLSILIVVAIVALIFGHKYWQSLPEQERAGFSKKSLLYGVLALVIGLVLAGRAHWLMGILAALLALLGRVAQFAQYIPLFKKIMGQEDGPKQAGSVAGQNAMSKQEAADILGVRIDANDQEVRLAHKRLMQKMHPDRGGSDTLAKQINQAKTVLLS